MITTEQLAPDTLALSVAGTIGAADVATAFDAIRALPVAGGINLLVDVAAEIAPSWREALTAEWRRRAEVIALIGRADRIALIAPQAWIRAAAWIEGRLIPGATYRTYRPEEAAVARAFALGEDARG